MSVVASDGAELSAFLSEIDTFSTLDAEVIRSIADSAELREFDPGEHLIWSGSVGEYLYIVKEGDIYVSLDSKDIELGRGAIVGEMALLSRKPSKADVVALSEAVALAIDFDTIHQLMEKHAELAAAISGLMKSRMFGEKGINRIGRYNVMGEFAAGGMSDLYYAVDTDTGEDVLIKMLSYEMSSKADFRSSFHSSFDPVINLSHPNILDVIETIEDYSTEFIVYEKMLGVDIYNCIEQEGVFDSKTTSQVLSKVAMALEFAGQEENGSLVHGDIELCEIMVDHNCDVKLMGFGLADYNASQKTVPFKAPEVLRGAAADHRADIYSLGVVGYYMLSGGLPYEATSQGDLIMEQDRSLEPDIEATVKGVSPGLAEFINRALKRDPEQRISNWFEVLTLLVSGRGSSYGLLSDKDKDTAIVIQMQSSGIDASKINQELHEILRAHGVRYDLEVVTRGNKDIDFSK